MKNITFISRIYTLVLVAALMISMTAGSAVQSYALEGDVDQQIENTGEDGSAVPDEDVPVPEEEIVQDETEIPDEELTEEGESSETSDEEASEEDPEDPKEPEEPEEPEEKELIFPRYTSRKVDARNLGVNLRTMIGEGNAGHAVTQGAATDGTYAYFLMACSANQKGRVVKTTLDGELVKAGPVIRTRHGNGMTYNSKINKLVSVGYDEWRHELTFIDPETLTVSYKKKVSYPNTIEGVPEEAYDNGIAAIAYVAKYNVYLARSRGYISKFKTGTNKTLHNIWVFDADSLEAIAHIDTVVNQKYPNVWQSMDADEKYVYYLLSPGKGQPNNIVLCLDWNSENLEPVINGEKSYIEHMWRCNDNGSGEPDAVMTMPFTRESEGLFHTVSVDEEGNVSNHFYASEYKGVQKYKTLTKKKAYKVKWKKVKKKVKWKKVRIKKGKNKGKYKWKYKKKKVWKYKTKYKTIKYTVKDYKARDDYIYDLGVF